MSAANIHAAAQAALQAHALPPGVLASIIQDVLALLAKWVPQILSGAPVAQLHADLTGLCAAHDQQRGLPPGTILRIIQVLLPILGQILSGFGGGTTPAP